MAFKKIKDTRQRKAIWVCTKCQSRDVSIITNEEAKNQKRSLT